jgi:hypothetical protein
MKSWIEHVKEFSKKNNLSYKEALQSPECRESYKKMKAGGLIGPAIRRDYPPQARQILEKFGNLPIRALVLQRVPIENTLKTLLNVLSLGKYEQVTQDLGYDKVFHLSLIVYLKRVRRPLVVEKNEVINISFQIPPMKRGGEQLEIPVNKNISLNELLNNTRNIQGSDFFLYHPFKRNCQMFIRDLLKNSGLLTPQAEAFIIQDAASILRKMPWYFEGLTKGLTDLGAQLNRIIYGKGF